MQWCRQAHKEKFLLVFTAFSNATAFNNAVSLSRYLRRQTILGIL